jgi:hypothetical protein
LLVVLVMTRWAWLQRGTSPAWWAGWLAAVLIITPYTRAYDGVLLLPMLGQMLIWRRWFFGLFVLLMIGYIQLPIGELGSVMASLTAWLLFIPWRRLLRGGLPAPFTAGWSSST